MLLGDGDVDGNSIVAPSGSIVVVGFSAPELVPFLVRLQVAALGLA